MTEKSFSDYEIYSYLSLYDTDTKMLENYSCFINEAIVLLRGCSGALSVYRESEMFKNQEESEYVLCYYETKSLKMAPQIT